MINLDHILSDRPRLTVNETVFCLKQNDNNMTKLHLAGLHVGLLSLGGAGCSTLTTRMAPVPQDFAIDYRVGGCYGTCPVYSLKISAAGVAVYEGVSYVETKGMKTIAVTPQKLQELSKEIDDIHFFSLKNEYITDQTGDMGRRSIRVTEKGEEKMVTYDVGTAEINELAMLIEHAVSVESLISASIDPAICTKSYGELKKQHDICQERLKDVDQAARSFTEKEEENKKREDLWKRIALSNNDRRWIGVVMMSSTSLFYSEQWDKTVVVEKKKSPSGRLTLVVFGQRYEPGDQPIQRGFYILNDKLELVGSYLVSDVWEHFSIGSVAWKDEQTISYDYYLATEGDGITPPEKRVYSFKK